jgi:hypothetical protein
MRMASHIDRWPLDQFIPYARNARTHSDDQVAQIAASIKEFGFVNPILVGPDRVIIAGHARLMAARKLGLTEAPVIIVEGLTENQRHALTLADNRLPLEAGWDEAMLRLEIEALRDADYDLDILGFEDDELANLLAQQDAAAGLTDEDAVPETLGSAPLSSLATTSGCVQSPQTKRWSPSMNSAGARLYDVNEPTARLSSIHRINRGEVETFRNDNRNRIKPHKAARAAVPAVLSKHTPHWRKRRTGAVASGKCGPPHKSRLFPGRRC